MSKPTFLDSPSPSHQMASEVAHLAAEKTEELIFKQLNALVSRGLLIVKKSQPVLVMTAQNQIEYRQTVELLPKEIEYIEKLEAENKQLREDLARAVTKIAELLKEQT